MLLNMVLTIFFIIFTNKKSSIDIITECQDQLSFRKFNPKKKYGR